MTEAAVPPAAAPASRREGALYYRHRLPVRIMHWINVVALTQGLLAALVSATAPADLRGTAFGIFNLASGIALLAASAIAGALWDAYGPAFTFYAGALFTALAAAGWLAWRRDLPRLADAA